MHHRWNEATEVKEMEAYTDALESYVSALRERSSQRAKQRLSEMRQFPLETIDELGIFYVGESVEMLIPSYLNQLQDFGVISGVDNRPIFHNRFAIPIKGVNGKILNLVGYSPDFKERYLYGKARYYLRKDTLWGLERLELAYEMGYAILVEGITDAIRLRSLGYKNTFAMCGTHRSEVAINQLNRCRHGIIRIPDRDNAGLRALKGWDYLRSITIYVPANVKDVDEACRAEGGIEWVKDYLDVAIELIQKDVHRGKRFQSEQVTML